MKNKQYILITILLFNFFFKVKTKADDIILKNNPGPINKKDKYDIEDLQKIDISNKYRSISIGNKIILIDSVKNDQSDKKIFHSCNTAINYSINTYDEVKKNQNQKNSTHNNIFQKAIKDLETHEIPTLILSYKNIPSFIIKKDTKSEKNLNNIEIIIKNKVLNGIEREKDDVYFSRSTSQHQIDCKQNINLTISLIPIDKKKLRTDKKESFYLSGKLKDMNIPIGIVNAILNSWNNDQIDIILSKKGMLISKGEFETNPEEEKIIKFIKKYKKKYKELKILAILNEKRRWIA